MSSPAKRIMSIVQRIVKLSIPPLFWTGYSCIVLVSSAHLQAWTVMISEVPRVRIFPRRWFGLLGEKVPDVWQAALQAVVGIVVFRPGISQVCRPVSIYLYNDN